MKLIHTADIHLDASFAGAGMPPSFGNRRRQCLRDVLAAIVQRAAEWPADAVLIAGDLFDLDRVTADTAAFLRSVFERIQPVPVFIAPGNHDPFVPGSPYVTERWPENVVIFERPEWQAHDVADVPLTVHGFGFNAFNITENPFGALHPPDDGRVHVAVAHGSERGRQPAGKTAYAAFDAADAADPNLHYLALGHFHRVTPITGPFTAAIYYSGAPEPHGFDETGPLHYLEVEITPQPSGAPAAQVNPVSAARTVYETYDIECDEQSHSQQIIDAIRALPAPEGRERIARIALRGTCPPPLQSALPAVYDAVAERFAFLDLVDETHPAEDYGALAAAGTTLGIFIQRLSREIDEAPDARTRAMLERARQVGLTAYRGRETPIRGLERGSA